MESLDREIAKAFSAEVPPAGPGRILIVATPGSRRQDLESALGERGHQVRSLGSRAEAEAVGAQGFPVSRPGYRGSHPACRGKRAAASPE